MSDSDLIHGSSEDSEKLLGQMEELKRGQKEIVETLRATNVELHKLKVSITGDDMGNKGIAQRVNDAEKDANRNKAAIATMKNDLRWWGILVTAFSALIALVITNWNKIFG